MEVDVPGEGDGVAMVQILFYNRKDGVFFIHQLSSFFEQKNILLFANKIVHLSLYRPSRRKRAKLLRGMHP